MIVTGGSSGALIDFELKLGGGGFGSRTSSLDYLNLFVIINLSA